MQNVQYLTIQSHEISRLVWKIVYCHYECNQLGKLTCSLCSNQHWCTFSGTLSHTGILHICVNTDDCAFTYYYIRYDILDVL